MEDWRVRKEQSMGGRRTGMLETDRFFFFFPLDSLSFLFWRTIFLDGWVDGIA